MSHRTDKLNEQLLSGRQLLRWFGVIAATAVLAAAVITSGRAHAADSTATGMLLRPGNWSQQDNSYLLPSPLAVKPGQWPLDGWYRVVHKTGHLQVTAVPTPAKGLPDFLFTIALQLNNDAGDDDFTEQTEIYDTQYIRVPGVALREGRLPTLKFSNTVLRPQLDHVYALEMGGTPFTLRVQDGLRTAGGKAYGEGVLVDVGYAGESHSYFLGRCGRDAVIEAVADLDGDDRPDFIVRLNRGAASGEFLLLSGKAKPGRNQPSATLRSQGC